MKHKRRGSALPIAMIMLLALTILGIAGMRMTDTELKITNSIQQFTTAFFAAESAIASSLENGELIDGMTATNDDPIVVSPEVTGQATRSYLARGPVPGGGYSVANNSYAAYHFQAIGVGSAPNNANVALVQGVYLVARGSN